jgi:enoyl-CoA hydratase
MAAINVEVKDNIAWLTIDRPPANALSYSVYQEISAAFGTIDAADGVRATVIKANGRFFSAGNDVGDMAGLAAFSADGKPYAETVEEGLTSIIRSPKPVISLVQGIATGAGFCIPSYSDIVIASPNAAFGIAEIKRGVVGGAPEASYSLPPKIVRYMALTGALLSAEDAYRYGFVLRIVPEGELLAEGGRAAREILANPPIAVRLMKESLSQIYPPAHIASLVEGDEGRCAASVMTEDFKESVKAFLEKRPPVYKNR